MGGCSKSELVSLIMALLARVSSTYLFVTPRVASRNASYTLVTLCAGSSLRKKNPGLCEFTSDLTVTKYQALWYRINIWNSRETGKHDDYSMRPVTHRGMLRVCGGMQSCGQSGFAYGGYSHPVLVLASSPYPPSIESSPHLCMSSHRISS